MSRDQQHAGQHHHDAGDRVIPTAAERGEPDAAARHRESDEKDQQADDQGHALAPDAGQRRVTPAKALSLSRLRLMAAEATVSPTRRLKQCAALSQHAELCNRSEERRVGYECVSTCSSRMLQY